jgi:hypothetical protein
MSPPSTLELLSPVRDISIAIAIPQGRRRRYIEVLALRGTTPGSGQQCGAVGLHHPQDLLKTIKR